MPSLSFSALMPPMCLLWVTIVGVLVAFRWRRLGLTIALLSSLALYALCTPFVSERLLRSLESSVPAPSADAVASAEAIVILSGDFEYADPNQSEGTDANDVGLLTLERLRLAAHLYRRKPLPVLVTGGSEPGKESAAAIMARVLAQDYGIQARWIEDKALTTYENATYSVAILRKNHVSRAIIVTQAWHLPRAIWSFERAGVIAIPAPSEHSRRATSTGWTALTPDYNSFARSFFAIHEKLGLLDYRYRYGGTDSATSAGAPAR
jgi:uncharacterized SAM-binding protein YcdF (DUF218 family)